MTYYRVIILKPVSKGIVGEILHRKPTWDDVKYLEMLHCENDKLAVVLNYYKLEDE